MASHMASSQQLQKTLRSDGPVRNRKGGDPNCILNQVQVAASRRMEVISNKRMGSKGGPRAMPKRTDQEMAEMRVGGASEDAAREIAFQAREQMNFLQDVQTRVDNALSKSVELLVEPEMDPANPQVSGKQWIESSKRMVNGAMFRYSESCEEREEQLTDFCDWFELYENIWPLPLVSTEVQYEEFLGKDSAAAVSVTDEDGASNMVLHEMWPKMAKMREDLSGLMKLTSSMGQKALHGETKEENLSLRNMIQDHADKIQEQDEEMEAQKLAMQGVREENARVKTHQAATLLKHTQELANLKRNMHVEQLRFEDQLKQCDARNALIINSTKAKMESEREAAAVESTAFKALIDKLEKRTVELEQAKVQNLQEIRLKTELCSGLTARNDIMHMEVEMVKTQLEQVTAELTEERENPYVQQLEKQGAEMKGRVLDLQDALLRAEAAIAGHEVTLLEQSLVIDEYKRKLDVIEIQTRKHREEITKIEIALKEAQVMAKEHKKDLEKTRKALRESEGRLATVTGEKKALEEQLSNERSRFEVRVSEERARVAKMEDDRFNDQKEVGYTPNPTPDTRNLTPETRNPKPGTRHPTRPEGGSTP
ncbi:hypothetical protein T484DRAFT_2253106 [Baffinella frigidus]|nr:hypothetical protein T484DRAFT_2253106 [Cryptophyta sp. CCMP2293]